MRAFSWTVTGATAVIVAKVVVKMVVTMVAITMPFLISGCGALPHDTSVRLRGSVPGQDQFTTLDSWRGFGDDLSLAPRAQIQLSGTMLAWDPAASSASIARMTMEVANLRRVWAEYYETKFHHIHDAQQRVDNLTASLRQMRRDVQAVPATRDLQLAAAESWWDSQLALLERMGVVDPAGGADHARNVFHKFCDAKVWEFATAPQMLSAAFETRPTPFGPCEAWYAARGYFGGTRCAISRDHALSRSGAWFDCFWHEGVMRTHAFHARYGMEKTARIHQYLDDGDLRLALHAADRAADARASILGMKKARKKTFARFENDPEEDVLRELFVPDRNPGRHSLDLVTPRALMDNVEEHPRSQSGINPGLAFFPRAATDDLPFLMEREAHAAFAALGKRDFVTFNSTSDFLWNGWSLTMPWSQMIDAAEVHPWLAVILGAIPADASAAMRDLRRQLDDAKSSLSALLDRQSSVDQAFSEQAARTLAASVQPGIAQAFWPEVSLRISATGADARASVGPQTELALALSRDREPILGQLRDSGDDCAGDMSLCAWLDSRSGALRIKLSPAQLDAQGFGVRVTAPQDIDARTRGFNEMPPELDSGTGLEMILFIGRMGPGGRTPVISGRTIFRRESPSGLAFEVEGEVSFLRL